MSDDSEPEVFTDGVEMNPEVKVAQRLKYYVAQRGHIQGTITRLYNTLSDKEKLKSTPLQSLQMKRQDAIEAFTSFRKINLRIITIDESKVPDDLLDKVEEKYYGVISFIDSEIESRQPAATGSPPPPDSAHKRLAKLPTLGIPTFSGRYSEYTNFIQVYKSVFEKDTSLDSIQKLQYLRSFLRDEPYDLIKNLPMVEASYNEAIKMLEHRYANMFQIRNEHISAILDLPVISRSTSVKLREFVSKVKQNLAAIKNMNVNVDCWDPVLICILFRKLDQYTSRSFHMERDPSTEPSVTSLLEFLERRALALENADSSASGKGLPGNQKPPKLAVNVAPAMSSSACYYCKLQHKLFECKEFKLLPSLDRVKFAKDNSLCDICMNKHSGKCKYHFKCGVCKKGHNTLLHTEPEKEADPGPVVMISGKSTNNILIPTARVKLFGRDNKEVHVKAILDSASQASLITSKAVEVLGLAPMRNRTNIIGVTDTKNSVMFSVPLEIHSLTSSYKTSVNCHVVQKITCRLPQEKVDTSNIKIPPGIKLADEEYYLPSEINLLIGADVFFQVLRPTPSFESTPSRQAEVSVSSSLPPERATGLSSLYPKEGTPRLVNTAFGYIIGGNLPSQQEVTKLISLFCAKCDDNLNEDIKNFFDTEKVPETFKEGLSEHDVVEKHFQNTVKLDNKKFQVDLPLKVPIHEINNTLGESFDLALYRFLNLEKKLQKQPYLLTEYQKFIDEYVDLKHAHYINFDSYDLERDPVYFIPHHAVINEGSKTTRTRVVFDASMKTRNKLSLNDLLLNGPVVQRELFDVLTLYRFGDYTFNTDIKKMFRGISVNPQHTSLTNILWRSDPGESIKCLRLDTVTYGLKSSSYLATRCLLELAQRYELSFPLASSVIKNCVYVDDVLVSHSDLSTLHETKTQLTELLSLGGFELHKWSSNNKDILSDIPFSLQQLDEKDFQKENYNIKALGLTLNVNKYSFVIRPPRQNSNSGNSTKREILREIAKFYDPLGFVSPVIVKAKVIMQSLWLENIDWDACPPLPIQNEWNEFSNSLASMSPIELQRNISIPRDAAAVQLVGFADASSSVGYGCCVYVRVVHQTGKVHTAFLCSKSRINPKSKPLTVPKLELNACVLLSKLVARVHEIISTKVKLDQVFLFSDSQIALAWLKSDIAKLPAYVSNRVRVVQQFTNRWRWLYVNTQDNPADLNPQKLSSCKFWWNGPDFLRDKDFSFQNCIQLPDVQTSKVASPRDVILLALNQTEILDNIINNGSDVNKMQRVLSYVLCFANNARSGHKKIYSDFICTGDFSYLTPGHFLVGGPLVSLPEPDVSEVPANRLKFWSLVESIKQCFWKAWHKHYLNVLQCRAKWRDTLPNIQVGSLVIMREPNSPPLYWPMARVVQVFPGGDGKVRALELKTANGKMYTRSLSSVCVLPCS